MICNDGETCVDCYRGHFLTQNFNSCVIICPNGDSNVLGQYISKNSSQTTKLCANCMPYCNSCVNYTTCNDCFTGKVLTFNQISCLSGCQSGNSINIRGQYLSSATSMNTQICA